MSSQAVAQAFALVDKGAQNEGTMLVRALETMEEELAIRIIPEKRSVMLLQVSKTMRTAMQRVSPPAMIKVKKGQTLLTESVKTAILDMMKWCRITAINLSNSTIGAEGAGRLAAVLGQCASLAHLDLCYNGIGAACIPALLAHAQSVHCVGFE